MPDDSNDLSITELLDRANNEGTPFADVVAKLPNPTQTTDPVEEVKETKSETETPAASSEAQVETETQTEQEAEEVQISPQEALFNQLRAQFPNESLVILAAKAEAAFSTETPQSENDQTDILAEILSDYESMIQAAKEADESVKALLNPEDGTIAEYTSEIRDAERVAMKAALAAESAFDKLAFEANQAVENEFPELNDTASPAFRTVEKMLQDDPSIAASSPIAVAKLARIVASSLREAAPAAAPAKTFASPTRVPAPAGPKPPVAALSSAAQAPHASATAPTPGQSTKPNLGSEFLASGMSVNDFFDKAIGGSSLGVMAS